MKNKFSNLIWGTALLLAAAFVLANQFSDFAGIGTGSLIITILSLVFIVQCIADGHLPPVLIPLAVLYIIFRRSLNMPYVQPWTLITASVLAVIGLEMLIPRKYMDQQKHREKFRGEQSQAHPYTHTENGANNNNPVFDVKLGAFKRYLSSDCLETAQIFCHAGSLELFLDQVQLSPNGAEVYLSCSFASVTLFVPKHWRIIEQLNSTLGSVNIGKNFPGPDGNAPRLTLSGNVSMSNMDIRYI